MLESWSWQFCRGACGNPVFKPCRGSCFANPSKLANTPEKANGLDVQMPSLSPESEFKSVFAVYCDAERTLAVAGSTDHSLPSSGRILSLFRWLCWRHSSRVSVPHVSELMRDTHVTSEYSTCYVDSYLLSWLFLLACPCTVGIYCLGRFLPVASSNVWRRYRMLCSDKRA